MEQQAFIEHIRQLVEYLNRGGEFTEELVDYLKDVQDSLAILYEAYAPGEPSEAEMLKELMAEALRLVHDGIDEILVYFDEPDDPSALACGLSQIEEGNDVLTSIRHSIENDTAWTTEASVS